MSEPDPSDAAEGMSHSAGHDDDAVDGDDVAALESRVGELASRVDEDVEDLRERLVRLYRDVEGKPDADHTHPETIDRLDELADGLGDVDETTGRVEAELGALADRLDDVTTDVDAATGSLEDVEDRLLRLETRVEELSDANDDAMEKLSRVASAVVRTQRRTRQTAQARSERDRLARILAKANRHGVRTADCDGCGNGVRLSLLSKPECPYCESRIDGIEPGRRFIGTSRLRVDDRPALEGDVAAGSDDGSDGDDGSDPAGPTVSARGAGIDDSTAADGSAVADDSMSPGTERTR